MPQSHPPWNDTSRLFWKKKDSKTEKEKSFHVLKKAGKRKGKDSQRIPLVSWN
jgi:hypothetical protein